MQKLRLLIIEDEFDIAILYKQYIAGFPIDVDIVSTVEDALSAIKSKPYDIIVADWVLQGKSGIFLAKLVRDMLNGDYPYMIMATVVNDMQSIQEILDAGYDDYLDKPISPVNFRVRIKVAQSSVNNRLQRKVAEKQLDEAHDQMTKVLNALNVGMVSLDRNNKLLYFNDTIARFAPHRPIINTDFASQIPLSTEEKKSLDSWLDTRGERNITIHVTDGNERWYEIENLSRKSDEKILYMKNITEVMLLKLNRHRRDMFTLVGESRAVENVRKQISIVSSGDWNVLIEGETGTGKELASREIHDTSPRHDTTFLAVNCSGLSETIAGSVLFGHKKGSFTGAITDHKGYFEAADGGTLFLDEIGDLSPSLQVMLLRAIEQKEITRIGENLPRKVNVRILSATNKKLSDEVATGRFRADLYYRLNSANLTLPPLRERKEDIPLLIDHFLHQFKVQYHLQHFKVSNDAMKLLMNYYWPGNVRQLKSVIQFAAVQASKGLITVDEMPEEICGNLKKYISPENLEMDTIKKAMVSAKGNMSKVAMILGMSRSTLYRKMKRYNIQD